MASSSLGAYTRVVSFPDLQYTKEGLDWTPKKHQKYVHKLPEKKKLSIHINQQLRTTDLANSIRFVGHHVNPCLHPGLASCNWPWINAFSSKWLIWVTCIVWPIQLLLSWLLHKWRESYLLPTIARKIICRHFNWMLQSSSGWKWSGREEQSSPTFDLRWCVSSVVHGYK